jgi:hypothetical protein
VASGCLVLVDGWNHFIAVQNCFGYGMAVKFPIDRLAKHVAAETGEDTLTGAVVIMAIPDPRQPGEEPDFSAWRRRLNKLHNYGIQHERARFSYHDMVCPSCRSILDRKLGCPACGTLTPVAGRRKEKGADIKLAALAINGAWRQDYSTLVIFSQDTDFGPLVRQLKDIYLQQQRHYNLYSAFPVCDASGHNHRELPGTRPLPLDEETYTRLAAQPHTSVRGQVS